MTAPRPRCEPPSEISFRGVTATGDGLGYCGPSSGPFLRRGYLLLSPLQALRAYGCDANGVRSQTLVKRYSFTTELAKPRFCMVRIGRKGGDGGVKIAPSCVGRGVMRLLRKNPAAACAFWCGSLSLGGRVSVWREVVIAECQEREKDEA